MIRFTLTLLVACFFLQPVQADNFGLAMHGTPKYTASSKALSYVNPAAPKGGTLAQGVTGTFDTLNPFSIKGIPAQGLDLVFDRLAARVWDEPFSLYGLIAQKISVPPDRSYVIFDLNPAATFHDGVPVTTEDVRFSFEQLRAKGRPNMRRVYQLVEQVTVETPHRIRFDFGVGYDRETAMILSLMPVLPKHWWEKRDLGNTTLDIPPGTGPYKIVSVDAGRKLVLERVKDDWAKTHLTRIGLNNFDTLTYTYFRDDTVALQAFKKGTLNLRREQNLTRWQTSYADLPPHIQKLDLPHQRTEPARGFIFNTRRPILNNTDVRHALQLAFDDSWLNKTQYNGKAKPIRSLFPNSDLALAWTDKNAPRRSVLKQANDLLTKAGYPVVNGKRDLTFTITLGKAEDEKIALHWARGLKSLGINVKIRTLDAAQFAGALGSFDYDVVLHQWLNSLSPGSEQILFWACGADGSKNLTGLCDTQIEASARAIATTTSRRDLIKATQILDKLVLAKHVFVPLLYEGVDHIALDQSIKRPKNTPLYGVVLESFWMDK